MRELSRKRQRFVLEYLKDQNGTQAAIRAGYSKKTAGSIAAEYLAIPSIKKAIDEEMAIVKKDCQVTAQSIIERLNELADRCLQKRPVIGAFGIQKKDKLGRHIWAFDSSGAARSLELLGKTLGMFVDKHDVSVGGRMIIRRPKKS